MKIINTAGWDTDCNAGNIGCLMGIKGGLEAIDVGIDQGKDWRGPVADRIYIPNADPSWGVSDCLRESEEIINAAKSMIGEENWHPKNGAQFHFEMPGSVQGFTVTHGEGNIENRSGVSKTGKFALTLTANGEARFGTPVFAPSKAVAKGFENNINPYKFVASPRIFPGQDITAELVDGNGAVASLYIAYYGPNDESVFIHSQKVTVRDNARLTLTVPAEAHPLFEVGIETSGTVSLDAIRWSGEPNVTFTRPEGKGTMWRRAWANGVDDFIPAPFVEPFRLVQNNGRGLLIQGNREWEDISVSADLAPHLMTAAGVAIRAQGMRRYYALLLHQNNEARLVKVIGSETVLASCPMEISWGEPYDISLSAKGNTLTGSINGEIVLTAEDSELNAGAVALVVEEGRTSTNSVTVQPV
jgi:hypothetical protein